MHANPDGCKPENLELDAKASSSAAAKFRASGDHAAAEKLEELARDKAEAAAYQREMASYDASAAA